MNDMKATDALIMDPLKELFGICTEKGGSPKAPQQRPRIPGTLPVHQQSTRLLPPGGQPLPLHREQRETVGDQRRGGSHTGVGIAAFDQTDALKDYSGALSDPSGGSESNPCTGASQETPDRENHRVRL